MAGTERARRSVRIERTVSVRHLPAPPLLCSDNLLLALLPTGCAGAPDAHLEPVHLRRKEVLFRAHEVLRVAYFPTTAISFVSTLESGQSLEVGLLGRDGLAGTSVFPGITTMSCDGIVQIPGLALRMRADDLRRELVADETLHSTIGRFAQVLLVRCMQMSVWNLFHSVEQRCIRCLLTLNDLVSRDDIPLTHELMATMLGVHRPTVTVVLRSLHRAGLVNEMRGRIILRDRAGLEAGCCECYRIMRSEPERLLGY